MGLDYVLEKKCAFCFRMVAISLSTYSIEVHHANYSLRQMCSFDVSISLTFDTQNRGDLVTLCCFISLLDGELRFYRFHVYKRLDSC